MAALSPGAFFSMTISARERLCAKPEEVQRVIKAQMVAKGIDLTNYEYARRMESLCGEALDEWECAVKQWLEVDPAETELSLARAFVSRLREQPVWGDIFREEQARNN